MAQLAWRAVLIDRPALWLSRWGRLASSPVIVGIATIYQEFSLYPELSVAERGRHGICLGVTQITPRHTQTNPFFQVTYLSVNSA
jgi:hypothetical protein